MRLVFLLILYHIRYHAMYTILTSQSADEDLLRFVLCLGPISSTIDICTFYLGLYYYQISAENPAEVALFRTHWFLQGCVLFPYMKILCTSLVANLEHRLATVF